MNQLELNSQTRCLVVGSGDMGRAHAKALVALLAGRVAVWSPSDRNRQLVHDEGAQFVGGRPLEDAVSKFKPTHAVVAAPVEDLPAVTCKLLDLGVRNILVEKPAVLDVATGRALQQAAQDVGGVIRVAYNRRFYAAVRTARALMEQGGEALTSIWFEFTEWAHVIEGLANQSELTKARWLLSNSMHVIDLAFLLCGMPRREESTFVHGGSLAWHPSAAVFAGAGRTAAGTPFAYTANWSAPGRWGIEWLTPSTRYIFRPMEKLYVMRRGSVAIEEVALLDDLDQRFKPGVYLQDQAFLSGQEGQLPDIGQAIDLVELAALMAGYPSA